MSSMELDEGRIYDLAEIDLKSFTRSSVRTKVMLTLLDGSKTASELEKLINTRSTTILHSIKSLIESGQVEKKMQQYKLTNIGRIQAIMLDDLINTIVTINNHHDFWLSHDMSGIPEDLQRRIGLLGEGDVIKDSPEMPLKSLDYFISALRESKVIRGVSPVLVKGYPEAMAYVVKNEALVELIITSPVLKAIQLEHKELLDDMLSKENFKLYSIDSDVKVSFLVTELFLNLGLSRIDGSYDLGTDLVFQGERAVLWGNMLFDHYKSKSNLLN